MIVFEIIAQAKIAIESVYETSISFAIAKKKQRKWFIVSVQCLAFA